MKRRFVLVLLLFSLSCRSQVHPPRAVVDDPARPPSNAEVLACLHGQVLPVGHSGPPPLVINLGGIEALSVARHSVPVRSDAWSTSLSIIYNTGRARYSFDGDIEHRIIDGQRVCSGFAVRRVVRR